MKLKKNLRHRSLPTNVWRICRPWRNQVDTIYCAIVQIIPLLLKTVILYYNIEL